MSVANCVIGYVLLIVGMASHMNEFFAAALGVFVANLVADLERGLKESQ